jgi:hypothetical protein
MPTLMTQMTCLRRIGRINKHKRHASRFSLVGHKLPQLVEAPTVVVVALGSTDLRPLANASQIFEGHLAPSGLCLLDKLLTDPVVDRSHMALLSSRQPFQKPFGFLRAFRLERTSDLGVVGTHPIDFGGFIGLCIGIDRHTSSAQIDAQRARGCLWKRSRTFELDMQEVRAIAALAQRGTRGSVAFESSLLVVTKRRVKPCTTVEQRQREGPVPFPEAEDTLIIVNRCGLKARMRLALDLQGRTDTSNGAYRQICRQSKLRPHIGVAGMLELHLVGGVLPPCDVRNEVAGVCKGDKRRIDLSALLWGWRQFTRQCAYRLHREIISHMYVTYKGRLKPEKAFPRLGINPRRFHGLKPTFCDVQDWQGRAGPWPALPPHRL